MAKAAKHDSRQCILTCHVSEWAMRRCAAICLFVLLRTAAVKCEEGPVTLLPHAASALQSTMSPSDTTQALCNVAQALLA